MLTKYHISHWQECISCSWIQANLPHSEWRQQNPEPGCFIYSRTLSSNGVSGEGWWECGKQTWLHPSAFQITGRRGGGKGWAERRGVVWCICWVQAQGGGELPWWRDDMRRSSGRKEKRNERWHEDKRKQNTKSSEEKNVGGRMCWGTVTMMYERYACTTYKRVKKTKGEDYRQCQWVHHGWSMVLKMWRVESETEHKDRRIKKNGKGG